MNRRSEKLIQQSPCRQHLVDAAQKIEVYVDDRLKLLIQDIGVIEKEKRRIKSLKKINEKSERNKELRTTLAALDFTKSKYIQISKKAGLFGFRSPGKKYRAWKIYRQAQIDYADAVKDFEQPKAKDERQKRILKHNKNVDAQRSKVPNLEAMLRDRRREHKSLTTFRNNSQEAIVAACGDGWLASSFSDHFLLLTEAITKGDIEKADKQLPKLGFQRKPTKDAYETWTSKADGLREEAYRDYIGAIVSGAYPEIVGRTIELTANGLESDPADSLKQLEHTEQKWQLFLRLVADPRNFKVDAIWTVYWAMFQCGQKMADILIYTREHEDVLNGKFAAYLDQFTSTWAKNYISGFGYPQARSYLGALSIASSKQETRSGADFGIIIDINIGGLVCSKAILLQAKKATQGSANIGSKTGQLSKLARTPETGFYLFYNQSPPDLNPPAPTVCSAQTLLRRVEASNRDPNSSSLQLKVNQESWDWASFISFGLCGMNNNVGKPFDDIDEAFNILSNGDPSDLPAFLHVIAINDEERVKTLRQRVRSYYQEPKKTLTRGLNKRNGLSQ